MRTKSCRKLRDAICHDACLIKIERDRIWTAHPPELHQNLEDWARMDGFASWPEMRDWFDQTHGLPFTGTLIRWLVPNEPSACNTQPERTHP